jgi:quinol monooxygenase YgiN
MKFGAGTGSQEGHVIHVLATIEIQPGRRADFLTEFRRVVPLVRAESGCLEYGPAVDVETGISAQGPLRADTVTVIEKWEDLAALKAHLAAPHMAEYKERVKDLVLAVALQVVEPV